MTTLSHLASCPFLIIGGTSKAGTTSVFNYLADHPSISATPAKETRFFLDSEYPLPSTKRYQTDGLDGYETFFRDVPRREYQCMLEATPDYLYSEGTAVRIRQALKNVQFIFLLREPFSRLVSFYRFGQRMNEIPGSMSFDQFIDLQRQDEESANGKVVSHPAFYALRHGRYSSYLPAFLDIFGKSAVHVAFYEELRDNPHDFMDSLCSRIGLDKAFYQNYSFQVMNQGLNVRSPRVNQGFYRFKSALRALVRGHPMLRAVMRRVGKNVNKVYQGVNVAKSKETSISAETKQFVQTYYADEGKRLEKLLGMTVPWLKT